MRLDNIPRHRLNFEYLPRYQRSWRFGVNTFGNGFTVYGLGRAVHVWRGR